MDKPCSAFFAAEVCDATTAQSYSMPVTSCFHQRLFTNVFFSVPIPVTVTDFQPTGKAVLI